MSVRYIDDTRQVLGVAFNGEVSADYFKIIEAMHVCLVAHHEQYRKQNRVMYALHPFRVFLFVSRVLKVQDPDVLCACLLHDVVEDGGVAVDVLKEQFGERIAGFVAELTRPECQDRAERHRVLLEHAKLYSNEARIIKVADRIDNLADAFVNFGDIKLWHYTGESIDLYRALVEGLGPKCHDDEMFAPVCPVLAARWSAFGALEYLRRTINETIHAARDKRHLASFDSYTDIN